MNTKILSGLATGLVIFAFLGTAQALPILNIDIIGGLNFFVDQSVPVDPNIIQVPPGDADALAIRAILSNTGDESFYGIPSSGYYTSNPGDPFLLTGTTGIEDGTLINEGDGLTDLPANSPFIGGFIINPGEQIEFIQHVIEGMLCNACIGSGPPALEPAPVGSQITLIDSYFDFRSAELIGGILVSDPDLPPDNRVYANGLFPLTVTVVSPEPVPEPATIILFGTGIVGLVGTRLRRKK